MITADDRSLGTSRLASLVVVVEPVLRLADRGDHPLGHQSERADRLAAALVVRTD